MRQVIKHEVFGVIAYEESLLSGSKKILVNGVELEKVNKATYIGVVGEEEVKVVIDGSLLKGVKASVNDEVFEIVPASKWYEYVLYFLPLVLIIVWGNSVELCKIIPVVGGAIGGAISGVISVLALVFSKRTKNILYKVLIGLAGLVVTFAVCAAIGFMIVGAL